MAAWFDFVGADPSNVYGCNYAQPSTGSDPAILVEVRTQAPCRWLVRMVADATAAGTWQLTEGSTLGQRVQTLPGTTTSVEVAGTFVRLAWVASSIPAPTDRISATIGAST